MTFLRQMSDKIELCRTNVNRQVATAVALLLLSAVLDGAPGGAHPEVNPEVRSGGNCSIMSEGRPRLCPPRAERPLDPALPKTLKRMGSKGSALSGVQGQSPWPFFPYLARRRRPCCKGAHRDRQVPSMTHPDKLPDMEASADRVLILDFGSQVTQLIARRLRESGVYCEIWPYNADPARIRAFNPRAFILSGGPASVHRRPSRRARRRRCSSRACRCSASATASRPCAPSSAARCRAPTTASSAAPIVDVTEPCALFRGVWAPGAREQVWMSHGDRVTRLPPGFRVVATSEGAPFAAIADDAAPLLRRAVPSRGGAHAARRPVAAQLHPRDRRLPGRLDHGRLPRRRRSPASASRSARGG